MNWLKSTFCIVRLNVERADAGQSDKSFMLSYSRLRCGALRWFGANFVELCLLCPALWGIKRWCASDFLRLSDVWRLNSVCLYVAYVGPKSRTERPRKIKFGTEVAHVARDSDTTFKVKRSKINLHGTGTYRGGLPHNLFIVTIKCIFISAFLVYPCGSTAICFHHRGMPAIPHPEQLSNPQSD